jgi:hypothetical protein
MAIGTAATIGVGVSAISSGLSFKQAADQSRMASKARKASEKLVADARQKAEKDYYEGLNVPLDAYGEQCSLLKTWQTSSRLYRHCRRVTQGILSVGCRG